MEFFELYEHRFNGYKDVNTGQFKDFKKIKELLREYERRDEEINYLDEIIEELDEKAQLTHMELKKLTQGSAKYKDLKKKFDEFVKEINQLQEQKNLMMNDNFEIKEQVKKLI